MDADESCRIAQIQAGLKAIMLDRTTANRHSDTGIPGVFFVRRDMRSATEHRFDRPLASLIVQGAKKTVIGGEEYALAANNVLVVCVDIPSSSQLLEASAERPFLSIYFHLDSQTIADLGLNYVDTGHVYLGGQSEKATGKALANGYRDRVYLTSKSPWWIMERPGDFERFFDESRRRLNTDLIDFYHIHMIMHRGWKEKVVPFKLIDKINQLKAQGKIRYAGFSFHDGVPLFKKVVDANPEWDFCLIQQNLLDTEHEAGLAGLNYAAANGMGVSIMEPLRNGFLVNPPREIRAIYDAAINRRSPVEWAFDYLWDKPEVSVVVSGMGNMQNVVDNLAYASRSAPGMLSAEDRATIGKAASQYRSYPGHIPCTGCYNCIPCPQNVAIGYLFNMVNNQYRADGDLARAHRLVKYSMSPIQRGDKPDACNECGQCLPKCPQGINIPAELKRMGRELHL